MEALGCRAPNLVTRVSEYIPEIIDYVKTIIANGMAYAVNGSVYFNTAEFRSCADAPICPLACMHGAFHRQNSGCCLRLVARLGGRARWEKVERDGKRSSEMGTWFST